MRNSNSTEYPSKLAIIAWMLIGLMIGGTLVSYLTKEPSGICSELRVLELEDDRADALDVAIILTSGHFCLCCECLSGDWLPSPLLKRWIAGQASHFERGPPLALADTLAMGT